MMDMANQHCLVWLKKDLRVHDHEPLLLASRAKDFLCVYLFEPEVLAGPEYDTCHHEFLRESLAELQDKLRRRGAELHTMRGEATDCLSRLHAVYPFSCLLSHQETGHAVSYRRDLRVSDWCRAKGIKWHESSQHGIVRPLVSRDGWAKRWGQFMKAETCTPPERWTNCWSRRPTPDQQRTGKPGLETVIWSVEDLKNDLGELSPDKPLRQRGGEKQALACLQSFLHERGQEYRTDMSSPSRAWEGCSRLSPYLSFGCISLRHVHQSCQARQTEIKALRPKPASWGTSLSSFQGRLRWHCHFMQKLEDEPSIEFANMNRAFDGLREDDFDEALFDAWCQGRTGYPLVDACMRALHQGGWINFRMRAMLMSFAAYHLWLHWRRPAVFLAKHFLDFEPGIHYSQVQMQSGVTGINTVRIYSPIKQVVDQDPQGDFIKRFVPELEGVPAAFLPEPQLMTPLDQQAYGCVIGKDYPAPIVTHKVAYQAARQRVFAWRQRPEVKAQAEKVYQKHGSRRRPSEQRRRS